MNLYCVLSRGALGRRSRAVAIMVLKPIISATIILVATTDLMGELTLLLGSVVRHSMNELRWASIYDAKAALHTASNPASRVLKASNRMWLSNRDANPSSAQGGSSVRVS